MSQTPTPAPQRCARAWPWVCTLALTALACVPLGSYGNSARYSEAEPVPEPAPALGSPLLSAHLSAFGEEPPPLAEATSARRVEGNERSLDRLVLVFAHQLDASTIDSRSFAILRGDGRRVRPVRAVLAPADEGDENHSLTLFGNFGRAETPPVALHVIGQLYAENGEDLRGLDAAITGPEAPDHVVLVEQLEPSERRCPTAKQVVRVYWSDRLGPSSSAVLAQIDLRLADGNSTHPIDLDDQARHTTEPPPAPAEPAEPAVPCIDMRGDCSGPEDDNVLDLCVDRDPAVVQLRIAAGSFQDASGHPSAAVDVVLPNGRLPTAGTTPAP